MFIILIMVYISIYKAAFGSFLHFAVVLEFHNFTLWCLNP
jgi:hypothetical protein